MTIDIDEILHPTTVQALAYAIDYFNNYYQPGEPPISYHRYDHSDHIEVLVTWGYQGDFFVQSRIKLTVLYGLVGDWTDEIAVRAWIFWRNPITGIWHTTLESQQTSIHHWQEAHAHIKQEATDMALKRARIDAYYPATHTADVTIYPLPGEQILAVPLAQECGPELAALLPDCTLAIFYDTLPPSPYITSLLNGVPPPWITSALVKDGEITEGDLAFDPATQAELNAHAALPNVHHQATITAYVQGTQVLTLTTTYQDIPGAVLYLSPGRHIIFGNCYSRGNVQGMYLTVALNVAGVLEEPLAVWAPAADNVAYAMVTQFWRIHLTQVTILKLQARKDQDLGVYRIFPTHTTMLSITTADLS